MKKILALFFVCLVILVSGCGEVTTTSKTANKPPIPTMEDKKKASAEVLKIIGEMPYKTDEVEKMTWYTPWGKGSYGAQDAIYWYVGRKQDNVWMRALIVNFTKSMDWVFWDKVIFSTAEKNWEYKLKNVFAGQSGGGKHTQIVMGGKYETMDVPYEEVKTGYELLIKGTNPIIRLSGNEHHYDYKLTQEDINHLKTGVYLANELKIIGGNLVK
jgi:alanine-alpha-ketoisovalerate/valine-pyruvate aminotransferase